MKKFLLLSVIFLLAAQFSFAQSSQSQTNKKSKYIDTWFTISYKYYSGPVSPQYQKTYTVMINKDRSAEVSYHAGLDKMAPQVESFTISKSNHKKLTSAFKKTGILDGVMPVDSADGKIGGPEKSITITYGNTNPALDQPIRTVTFRKSMFTPAELVKLFDIMDNIVPKKVMKKFEKKNDSDAKDN